MHITQQELNEIIPKILKKSGSLSENILALKITELTKKECSLEDIKFYFEPTLQELETEAAMVWNSLT